MRPKISRHQARCGSRGCTASACPECSCACRSHDSGRQLLQLRPPLPRRHLLASTPAAAAATPAPATPPLLQTARQRLPAAPVAPAQAAVAPAPPADPIIAAVRTKLIEPGFITKADKDDITAAVTFYGARTGAPLWVDANGFTAKAKTAIEEVKKADDWGLQAAQFDLPTLADGQIFAGRAGCRRGQAYASSFRSMRATPKGGRVNPPSLSRILDVVPPLKDPAVVMTEIAASTTPDAYLRGLHPKHEQFEKLRLALADGARSAGRGADR